MTSLLWRRGTLSLTAILHRTCLLEPWCRACADRRLLQIVAIHRAAPEKPVLPVVRAFSWPRSPQGSLHVRVPASVFRHRWRLAEKPRDIVAESSSTPSS